MRTRRLTELQSRIYCLLREGRSQSYVSRVLKVHKGYVSRVARLLVKEGYLNPETEQRPFLYGPGPRAAELDRLIAARRAQGSLNDEVACDGRGVREVAKNTSAARTVNVHHVKVRFVVLKIGDKEFMRVKHEGAVYNLDFLEKDPYFSHNNVIRTKGVLHCPLGQLTVELEEAPSKAQLYIHLPESELTPESVQSGEWKRIYETIGQEAGNWVQKWAGWELGLMELCPSWKPHFAVHDPRILRHVIAKSTAQNTDQSVWLSDSQGKAEFETHREELAGVIVDLPGAVYELQLVVSELTRVLRATIENEEHLAELAVLRQQREVGGNGVMK